MVNAFQAKTCLQNLPQNAIQAKQYIQNLPQKINQEEIKKTITEVKTSFSSGIVFSKVSKECSSRIRLDITHFINNTLCYYLDLISGYGDILFSLLGFGFWQEWLPYFEVVDRVITLLPIIGLIIVLSIPILPLLIIFAPLGILLITIVVLLTVFVLFSSLSMFVKSDKFSSKKIVSTLDNYSLKKPAQNADGSWDYVRLTKTLAIGIGIQLWKFYKYGLFRFPKSHPPQQQQQNTDINSSLQYQPLFDRIPSSVVCRNFMFEITNSIRRILVSAHHPNFRTILNNTNNDTLQDSSVYKQQ